MSAPQEARAPQRTESPDLPVYDSALRPHPFVEELQELVRYRDLVALWATRNITLRYKRSVLGVLWTLLEPLLMMVILSFVFSQIFRFSVANYPIYVLAGLIFYDFFSRSTTQMVEEVTASQNLAQRIHVPRSAFAVATIGSYLANWMLALIPLFAIMLFLRHPLTWVVVTLPLAMLAASLFALGVGLVISTLGAFFPDVKLSYKVLLNAWFYATPIIYPVHIIPERWRPLFELNPLHHLLSAFRTPVYDGYVAPLRTWALSLAFGFAAAALGWWAFTRWRKAFEYRV